MYLGSKRNRRGSGLRGSCLAENASPHAGQFVLFASLAEIVRHREDSERTPFRKHRPSGIHVLRQNELTRSQQPTGIIALDLETTHIVVSRLKRRFRD
jgi:hypothetical protein